MRCFPALHGWDGARTSDGSWRTGTWVRSVSHYAIANSTSTGRPTRAPVAQTNRTSAHRRSSCFAIFFPVAIPERPHPFPSRTRKLSSPGPMVLQGQLCGRVGRCWGFEGPYRKIRAFVFFGGDVPLPSSARECAEVTPPRVARADFRARRGVPGCRMRSRGRAR